jgi:hypothetical protein
MDHNEQTLLSDILLQQNIKEQHSEDQHSEEESPRKELTIEDYTDKKYTKDYSGYDEWPNLEEIHNFIGDSIRYFLIEIAFEIFCGSVTLCGQLTDFKAPIKIENNEAKYKIQVIIQDDQCVIQVKQRGIGKNGEVFRCKKLLFHDLDSFNVYAVLRNELDSLRSTVNFIYEFHRPAMMRRYSDFSD